MSWLSCEEGEGVCRSTILCQSSESKGVEERKGEVEEEGEEGGLLATLIDGVCLFYQGGLRRGISEGC